MDRPSSDAILIERAQRGDRSAFDDLVRRYEAKAYQYAFRLTRNQEEACDVVSDAFIRVYNALHNFKGQSTFSTWLYRILTNCFLDSRKKEKNRQTVSLEANFQTLEGEIEREVEDERPSPLEETEKNEREARMQRAVAMLPEFQRAMIVMYHAEDMTYEEIAESLDLPVGTVKSRLNRARSSLRELLMKDSELFSAS
ncbi:MAG: sigma-70 family RNA polymerase sigma factor [Armatimonadetes bacterium]|nr:sigma-70 family RNA polymerase sigma factor [Armatimonadota bacterium]